MTQSTLNHEWPAILKGAETLPSLPSVAIAVLRLTEDEDSTIDELAEALERDPVLSMKLLKLSNSSLFSVGSEITTLQRATMVLGMKTVKLMSLSFSLVGTLPKKGEGDFDLEGYWHHSLVGAVVARSLAQYVGSHEGDEAFLCGLLGHIGKLVLWRCLPAQYAEVLAESGPWPTQGDETRLLGFSSADVATALLQEWGIPPTVTHAIAFMTRPEEAPRGIEERQRRLIDLMNVAHLGEAVICNEADARVLQHLYERAARVCDMDEAAVNEFLMGLEPAIRETAETLSVPYSSERSHEEILDAARTKMVQISLGTTVDLHEERRRNAVLQNESRDLRERATTDALTGLPNRAAFDDMLDVQIKARLAGPVPRGLGLVMIDIDKFKSFNDTYGHQTGDEILRMVGGILQRITRKGDLPARYGGEEFAIVAPQTTPYGLRVLCERLRNTIAGEKLEVDGAKLSVTASFGAACITSFATKEDSTFLIQLADRLLYRAKKNGRNRSEVYSRAHFPGR